MRLHRFLPVLCLLLVPAARAFAAEATVPGSSNPNLAGRAAGYTCCSGDAAPLHSPVLVTGLEISSCDAIRITASGRVSFSPGAPAGNNPDGDSIFHMTNFGDGISAPLNVRTNALFGVFLGDDSPTGSPTPGRIDFVSGLNFASLTPGIGQIFFVGDGRSTDSKAGVYDGPLQSFVAPRGASRLFLGTGDGGGWYNNSGSFSVEVTSTPAEGGICGDPVGPGSINASDALHVLRSAVGTASCPSCVCDVDDSGTIAASDALVVLRAAVGHQVNLFCACCVLT